MLEVLTLFILASVLGTVLTFLLRLVCRFNKNQPFFLDSVSISSVEAQKFFDPKIALLLIPAALQAVLLSQVRMEESFAFREVAYFSIGIFLFLNMAAYLSVIEGSEKR